MPAPARYGPPDGNADFRGYSRLVAATFGADPDAIAGWLADLGTANIRVLRNNGDLQAGLSIYTMGQYFGGRSVPIWGLAGVVLPPQRRASGLGRELLTACLREQHKSGPPLASLFPASTHVYRALGYEQAGCRLTARVRALDIPAPGAGLSSRAVSAGDWPEIRRLYAQARAHDTGCLDRSQAIWERLRRVPPQGMLQGLLIEGAQGPEGYLLFTLARRDGTLRLDMTVRDWAFVSPRARDALLRLLWVQRSVVGEITLQLGPNDPLLQGLCHDNNAQMVEHLVWMLRVVQVPQALAARGWPAIDAEASFTVTDDQLKENTGPWRVRLRGGKASVAKARAASVRVHTCGLAALYSGFMAPPALRRAGLLQGSDRHDAALAAMFAGPAPYLLDFF